MSASGKCAEVHPESIQALPGVLRSLGFRRKPRFNEWQNPAKLRIHWAVRVLKYSGFGPFDSYEFERYHGGPYSASLERDLESLDWNMVCSAEEVDDAKMALTRDAILKGDDFLLALAMALGIAEQNEGISKREIMEMIVQIMPYLTDSVEEACDYAEVRIWNK